MPIDRTAYNALVDSDGSPGSGSVWDKAAIAGVILDPIDALFATILYVNDTSNANMTIGVTINQGANDNEILCLKSSDVAHGMTVVTETDSYGIFQKQSGSVGGLAITGLSEDATSGITMRAISTTADVAKNTSAGSAFMVNGQARNGTGVQSLGSNGNIMTIRDNDVTQFIFDVEGSGHANVEWIAFDTHDDVALLDALDTRMRARNAVTNAFGEALQYHKADLEAAGIVHFYDDGPKAMVNFTRLAMLHTGAIRQQGRQMAALMRALVSAGVVTLAQLDQV